MIKYAPRTKEALEAIKKYQSKTENALVKSLNQIGKQLMSTGKKLIEDKNKSGRIYYNVHYTSTSGKNVGKGMTKKTHQASAPGQPPANLSGRLKKSLNFTRQGAKSITFGNSAPYAAVMEFGKGKIKARPYMITSIEQNKKDIENILESEVKIELTKTGPF